MRWRSGEGSHAVGRKLRGFWAHFFGRLERGEQLVRCVFCVSWLISGLFQGSLYAGAMRLAGKTFCSDISHFFSFRKVPCLVQCCTTRLCFMSMASFALFSTIRMWKSPFPMPSLLVQQSDLRLQLLVSFAFFVCCVCFLRVLKNRNADRLDQMQAASDHPISWFHFVCTGRLRQIWNCRTLARFGFRGMVSLLLFKHNELKGVGATGLRNIPCFSAYFGMNTVAKVMQHFLILCHWFLTGVFFFRSISRPRTTDVLCRCGRCFWAARLQDSAFGE